MGQRKDGRGNICPVTIILPTLAMEADRDVEKEKLICSNKFYDMLMAEWKSKTKEEKQEFISKFLESLTIEKDEKGNYNLVNIKLRNTFIEQIYKLMQNGMFDMTISDEKDKDVKTTIMMDKQELQEYINRLNEYYEVNLYKGTFYKDTEKLDIGPILKDEVPVRIFPLQQNNYGDNNWLSMGMLATKNNPNDIKINIRDVFETIPDNVIEEDF